MSAAVGELILVKGAPGVGKSTAARHLARRFPAAVLLEVDALRNMVVHVDWKNQVEHRSVLVVSACLAASFLEAGFTPVVLVDTFSGDKIDGFLSSFRAHRPEVAVFVAVLHASSEVLSARVANREVGGFRDLGISHRINVEVVRGVRPFERLIDTSCLSPVDVAEAILRARDGDVGAAGIHEP